MSALLLVPLVITATRAPEPSFEVPAPVAAIEAPVLAEAGPRASAAEALSRAPGVVARDRQNWAQDVQIESRGYGARASFGVRGMRILSDGVPLTMPDGQSQASSLDVFSARRIEVLRGPFSALYGNASGGVIELFSAEGGSAPVAGAGVFAGSYGFRRATLSTEGTAGRAAYAADVSNLQTQGYRSHSAARRGQAHAKVGWDLGGGDRLTLVADALDQPKGDDPLGLTRAQTDANPRQAAPAAEQFDARKTLDHEQAGLVYEKRAGRRNDLRFMVYGGHRALTQYQAIPVAAQAAATSPGGVVDLDRGFAGADARWTRREDAWSLALGGSWDGLSDRRRGYQNFIGSRLGVRGALRRNERDTVQAWGEYAQARWEPHPRWRLDAGLRGSQVQYGVRDYYLAPGNGDDGGRRTFSALTPVAGVLFRASPSAHLYASAGEGFETPTTDELAYRPDGAAGLNSSLNAATSRTAEAGVKLKSGGARAEASVFAADTRNEIVVIANTGGRSLFGNAGRTRRRGAELLAEAPLGAGLRAYASATFLDARFADDFSECSGTPCVTPRRVPAGSRLPGVPRSFLYGELSWTPAEGLSTAVEASRSEKVFVDDANSQAADRYAVLAWRVSARRDIGAWTLDGLFRLDNLLDARYVGSVVVAETSGRYYEPAPGRRWLAGLTLSRHFSFQTGS